MIDITRNYIIENFEDFQIKKYKNVLEFFENPNKYHSNNQVRLKNSKFYKFSNVDDIINNYDSLKIEPKLKIIEKISLFRENFVDRERNYFEDLKEFNMRTKHNNKLLTTDFSKGIINSISINLNENSLIKKKDYGLIECEIYDDSNIIPAVYIYKEPLSQSYDYETLIEIIDSNLDKKFDIEFKIMDEYYPIIREGMTILRGKKLLLTSVESDDSGMRKYFENITSDLTLK